MLEPLDRQPRGLAGRPLFALLFAVGLGIGAAYLGSLLHLSNVAILVMVVGIGGALAGLWHWVDRER